MGLDAYVRCNCWEEGLATPPPRPQFVRLDEDGNILFDLPYRGHEKDHLLFDNWLRTCCPHPEMEYSSEHIANWGGYRFFRSMLEQIGWEHFPTLEWELPEANGGQTGPEASKRAMSELDLFDQTAVSQSFVVLANLTTGKVLQEHVPAYGGLFFLGGQADVDMGLDENGFFVVEHQSKQKSGVPLELFRSMEFTQVCIAEGSFRFQDLSTGIAFDSPVGVSGEIEQQSIQPKRLRVERRPVAPDEFEYILGPLRRVFQASVETGNPVHWC